MNVQILLIQKCLHAKSLVLVYENFYQTFMNYFVVRYVVYCKTLGVHIPLLGWII